MLERQTKRARPEGRASALDAVRAAACLAVVAGHAIPSEPLGPLGVSIFFVLSGYLIWRPWVSGRPDVPTYALHRAARILPGFALAVFVLAPDPWPYLAFVKSYAWTQPEPVHASWTLVVEVTFYLLVPFLALVPRAPLVVLVGSLAASFALTGTVDPRTAEMVPLARLWQFVPGMWLATLSKRPGWWLPAGIALAALTPAWPFLNLPSVLAGTLLVGWAIGRDVPFARLAAIGAALTFPVYLWHQDLFRIFGVPLGLAAVLVVATASYLLVERPVLTFTRRLRPGSRPSWRTSPSQAGA